MTIPLRKGYQIKDSDHEKFSCLQFFEEQGFITFEKEKIITCNKCGASNPYSKNNIENYIICRNCRKKISNNKIKEMIQILKIHYDKINQKITEQINSNFESNYDNLRKCWFVKINDKTIPVIIPEISTSNSISCYGEEEGVVYIMLDKEKNLQNINSINESQFVDFFEILKNPEILKNKIIETTQTFSQNISIELDNKFDKKLNELTPYQFETFCVEFLDKIKENQMELSKFYNYLNRMKKTLVNSKIISLGGASNPDFHIINLSDYLQSGFKPDRTGEVKRYKKISRFTMEDFSKAIVQGYNKPALFILSTNNIQLEVWMQVIHNSKNGDFPYVIIDKDLLLTLIKCLKLNKLLE